MFAIERRNAILAALKEEKHVVVSELAKQFDVSEETIRRDLDKLEKEGYVVKTYGGAVISEGAAIELPYGVLKKASGEAKEKIAELAAELIMDGDTLILDASSTALFIAQKIKTKKDITLLTNSLEVLMELSDVTGWKILSTGGSLKERSCALIGSQAEECLERFHVDKAFISCKGVDAEHGFSDSSDAHAAVKRKMIAAASQVFFAVDSSKFGKLSFTSISGFSGVDAVITENCPNEDWNRLFITNDIECIYPRGNGNG